MSSFENILHMTTKYLSADHLKAKLFLSLSISSIPPSIMSNQSRWTVDFAITSFICGLKFLILFDD